MNSIYDRLDLSEAFDIVRVIYGRQRIYDLTFIDI